MYIKHMYMYYDILKNQFVVWVKVTRTCLGRDQKTQIDKYGIMQTVPMRTHAPGLMIASEFLNWSGPLLNLIFSRGILSVWLAMSSHMDSIGWVSTCQLTKIVLPSQFHPEFPLSHYSVLIIAFKCQNMKV